MSFSLQHWYINANPQNRGDGGTFLEPAPTHEVATMPRRENRLLAQNEKPELFRQFLENGTRERQARETAAPNIQHGVHLQQSTGIVHQVGQEESDIISAITPSLRRVSRAEARYSRQG